MYLKNRLFWTKFLSDCNCLRKQNRHEQKQRKCINGITWLEWWQWKKETLSVTTTLGFLYWFLWTTDFLKSKVKPLWKKCGFFVSQSGIFCAYRKVVSTLDDYKSKKNSSSSYTIFFWPLAMFNSSYKFTWKDIKSLNKINLILSMPDDW